MTIQQAIAALCAQKNLSAAEMEVVMKNIMTGQCTDSQIGGFLVALRNKGETTDEIRGAVQVMRELASQVDINANKLIDTCGTGGDSSGIFNVSTAAAFIVAASGGKVAKHGNRSVTSSSGSADLLEAAGVRLDLSPVDVARCVENIGVGFMFAVNHHSAMKHAIGPRKELALRTIFNLLGPLTNPAGAKHQMIGVFAEQWLQPMVEVLQQLGSTHVLCVHSSDGLDELSIAAPSYIAELHNGSIERFEVHPRDFGLKTHALESLVVNSAEQSLQLIRAALAGQHDAAGDMLALNAGAAIYAADLCASMQQGVDMAQDAIASGLALEKLKELVAFTQQLTAN